MNAVRVLVEGYARFLPDGGWEATSTCTLVTTPAGLRVVVDPGCVRDRLLGALHELRIEPASVAFVFLTHHHLDHALNVALFPNARVVDHEVIYDRGRATPVGATIPGTDLEVVLTPGHMDDHASLLVPTAGGIVAIAGDVFWWRDGEAPGLDVDRADDLATDLVRLRASRQLLLQRATTIIPGHGAPQRVP